ncbi:MAG: AAA family ATPase [Candidatus Hadarchaeota archaeon]
MPVISVLGTKGGVGKSTIAMGIASWLSKMQDDLVLLVDGDVHTRTVELKMCPKADVTLAEVLRGKHELVDAIYLCQLKSRGKWVFPQLAILPAGGQFMPAGGRDVNKFLTDTITSFDKVMPKLRGYFSYVIVDTPPSVMFEHFILTAISDGLIFTVTPDVESVFSSRQTAMGLKEMMGLKTVGTILNKIPRGMTLIDTWMDYASSIAPVIGTVYKDEIIDDAFRRNLPVVAAYPKSSAAISMKDVTKKILKMDIKPTRVTSRFKKALGQLWVPGKKWAADLEEPKKVSQKPKRLL